MTITKQHYGLIAMACLLIACSNDKVQNADTSGVESQGAGITSSTVETKFTKPQQPDGRPEAAQNNIVDFAETLVGVPYKYASSDPNVGFDCSGFISFVYHHFNVDVPRSSVDFTNVGTEIPLNEAKRGDLILFTGTDNTIRVVGHMGIVTSNTDSLRFIHATSGKQYSVTVTPLNEYYMKRFVKITRL